MKNKKKMGFANCMINMSDNWWHKLYNVIYFDMLSNCLKKTKITTCFFLNLYTFPVLYKRRCNQYILHQDVCNNNEFQQNNYIPVLSGCTTKEHFDKCIIYSDAWEVITKKRFGPICSNNFID